MQSFKGFRILIVEDHHDSLLILARVLRDRGFQVDEARSCAEALILFEKTEYDIVVSDLGLPDGHGNELLSKMLAKKPVKAIALTGYGMESDIAASAQVGFCAHVTKPVQLPMLLAVLEEILLSGN